MGTGCGEFVHVLHPISGALLEWHRSGDWWDCGHDIGRLFYSDGPVMFGMRSGINKSWQIEDWIKREHLTMDEVTIPLAQPVDTYECRIAFSGGGDAHAILKWSAYCWLRDQGGKPQYEYRWARRRIDTACPKLGISVECGNTPPEHVLYDLDGELWTDFVLVPFQSFTPNLKAHRFALTEDGRAEMERLADEQLAGMKRCADALSLKIKREA